MRTITTNIYTFDELSENAKESARQWYREQRLEYFWSDEAFDSLRAFCNQFNVKLKDYSIGTWCHSYVDTDATNQHFRGLKLKSVKREQSPTGYCADSILWYTFYDTFKASGNALYAFNEAIDAWVRDTVNEMEYQESDEFIDEHLTINEFEFTESGKLA